jgi:hypothetical protein
MQALRESLYRQHKNCKIHIQIAFQSKKDTKMEISSELRANSMHGVARGTEQNRAYRIIMGLATIHDRIGGITPHPAQERSQIPIPARLQPSRDQGIPSRSHQLIGPCHTEYRHPATRLRTSV